MIFGILVAFILSINLTIVGASDLNNKYDTNILVSGNELKTQSRFLESRIN